MIVYIFSAEENLKGQACFMPFREENWISRSRGCVTIIAEKGDERRSFIC
jgi:hypothetical protein